MAQVRFKGLNIVRAIKREVFGIDTNVPEVPSDTFQVLFVCLTCNAMTSPVCLCVCFL